MRSLILFWVCITLLAGECFSQTELLVFSKNGKYGFVDHEGKVIIPIKYDYCSEFSDGLAKVELGGKKGFINYSGQEIIPIKFDDVSDFIDGLTKVSFHGKYGIMNLNGKVILPIKY